MPVEKYYYIKIKRLYYSLRQNPLILAWFLFFRNSSFQHKFTLSKKQVIKIIIILILHQLNLRNNDKLLELPGYGNLCFKVHRGHKIFNFQTKTVIKVIAAEIQSATVKQEFESVRKASALPFAPNILRWNTQERWYEEDFVNGSPCYPVDSSGLEVLFHKGIVQCLEQMIMLHSPVCMNLSEYVDKTLRILEDRKLSSQELDSDKVNFTRQYIEKIADELKLFGNCMIYLVFSHGDYSLENILKSKTGIKAIDYEGAALRNPLYDLYNFFFTEIYFERVDFNLEQVLNRAISFLQARLLQKEPELAKNLVSLAPIYRKLFYLERICMILERELDNNVLDVIHRSIEVFNLKKDN